MDAFKCWNGTVLPSDAECGAFVRSHPHAEDQATFVFREIVAQGKDAWLSNRSSALNKCRISSGGMLHVGARGPHEKLCYDCMEMQGAFG